MIQIIKKCRNPVYISDSDRLDYYFELYRQMNQLENNIVSIHSNSGIIFGVLQSLEKTWPTEASERALIKTTYVLKTNFYKAIKPNREDLGLFFENEDFAHHLFWNEHDDFKKEVLIKSINFSFVLGNIEKIDSQNHKIYVRKLKQYKDKE